MQTEEIPMTEKQTLEDRIRRLEGWVKDLGVALLLTVGITLSRLEPRHLVVVAVASVAAWFLLRRSLFR